MNDDGLKGPDSRTLAQSHDWRSTPLGARADWPAGLNGIVETVLSGGVPMALVLGPSFVLLYNDAYAALLGSKHPQVFGCPAAEALSENWSLPGHGDVVERVFRTGEPFVEGETKLPLRRGGPGAAAETVLFSRAYTPVRADDGTTIGVLTVITELTEVARALSGVAALSARLASALTVDDVVRETLRHAMEIGADHARVLLPEGSATRMARRAAADPWDESTERLPPLWVQVPADAPLPSAATIRDGRPRWLESHRELEPFRGGLEQEPIGATPLGAVASVPLPVGPWTGALSLGWHDGRAFSEAYQSALSTVGTLIGAALARAQRFDEQFGLADTLQRSLLPTGLPHLPGLVLGARYASHAPGSSMGGDFYDAFSLPDGRVLVAIGDVVGQGAEAATLSGQVRAALRALALQNPDPAGILAALDPLVRSLGAGALVTALIAVIDEPTGVLVLADAGHPQPLLRRRAGGPGAATIVDLPVGPPLGVSAPRASISRPFDPGDLLLLVNDGLLDDPAGGSGSLEPLRTVLADQPDLDPRQLCARLLELFETGHDDATLLAVARVDGERRTTARSLPAESTSPGQARRWARLLLTAWGLDDDRIEVAVLCLNELVTNALLHARTSARVELDLDESRLLVLVSDEGQAGTPTLKAQATQPDAVRGRGLALIEQLSAAWGTEWDRKGMTVWFELARGSAADPAEMP
jgi:anti-sigma regulatory factor (Ser/Thr protein kinase)